MNATGTTRWADPGIGHEDQIYVSATLLEHQMPYVVLDLAGKIVSMPTNKSQTVELRRPKTFDAVLTPLVEGVTPRATQFAYERVRGIIQQYGQVVEITDVVEDIAQDNVLQDATEQLSENVARSLEQLRYGALRGGTNVFYSNGTARTAVNSPLTLNGQRKVVRALKAQKAAHIRRVLKPSLNISTVPIEASYIAFVHTDLDADIRNMDGFVPTAKYGQMRVIHEQEIGAVEDVRYITSPDLEPYRGIGGAQTVGGMNPMIEVTNAKADVYPILYFGKNAYCMIPLRGEDAVEPMLVPVKTPTPSDPLAQKGSVGVKYWYLCLRINELWMARMECAASLL